MGLLILIDCNCNNIKKKNLSVILKWKKKIKDHGTDTKFVTYINVNWPNLNIYLYMYLQYAVVTSISSWPFVCYLIYPSWGCCDFSPCPKQLQIAGVSGCGKMGVLELPAAQEKKKGVCSSLWGLVASCGICVIRGRGVEPLRSSSCGRKSCKTSVI